MDPTLLIFLAPVAGLIALFSSGYLASCIMKLPAGSPKMKEIAKAIHDGAMAYLYREYRSVAVVVAALAILLGLVFGLPTVFAFLVGAGASAVAGYIGMNMAVRANVRMAEAAKKGLPHALAVAFNGGAVMGLTVVGLGLLGVSMVYFLYSDPRIILGVSFGASTVALFARVGGGIFTKAADVGADLVGKIEAGIPEDDPRNPAVIADNVGDNVGDTAGMGADLFESYIATLVSAMIIGAVTLGTTGIILPLIIGAVGAVASVIGTVFVKIWEAEPQQALNNGIFGTGIISAFLFYFVIKSMVGDMALYLALLVGLVATIMIGMITEHYTTSADEIIFKLSRHQPHARKIAEASLTGPATNVLAGFASGMRSTALPVGVICVSILLSYSFGGIFGIAIAAMGMLSLTGIIISVDSYGPIADNAGGIAEMAGMGPEIRRITDELDSVGNTTAAIAKGFAIGSAALTTLALFSAYIAETKLSSISITEPLVVVGLFIGGVLPFVFSAYSIQAVGQTAAKMIEEVRRQFREIKGLKEGKAKPDYVRCIDISTQAALQEMMAPALLALTVPIAVGMFLGLKALGGVLAGCIVSGLMLAIFMANAGGAWDNAKKFIEAGAHGGKGTATHAAAVIGDTIGDPFKDTAGPSLNILIKLVNTISLLFVPVFIAYGLQLV